MLPRNLLLFLLGVFSTATLRADDSSPVGMWKTIDDKTGHAKSVVEITETGGELTGKVVRVLESAHGPHPLCVNCEGERKDQPVEGMNIMWGVKREGGSWGGGKILDPENGKTYRVRLKLLDHGEKLDLRGYIGVSLLGRTQVWQREK